MSDEKAITVTPTDAADSERAATFEKYLNWWVKQPAVEAELIKIAIENQTRRISDAHKW